MKRLAAALAVLLVFATPIKAGEVKVLVSTDAKLGWRAVTLPCAKSLEYTHGIGSAAFRHRSDPPNVISTAGDRGPNLTCGATAKLISKELGKTCKTFKRGRVYPTPNYVPSIYKIAPDIDRGSFKFLDTIQLKTRSGKPIWGLLNPQTKATKNTGLDLSGKPLPDSADLVDFEGLVRLSDGSFWIGEEMGPPIAHVSSDGHILKRFVPADAAADYREVEAEIIATLSAILSKRQGNRGIESMAISPNEKFFYFIVQNPLTNPKAKAYAKAKNTRLFKMERESGRLVGEYVYQLDDPQSFGLDPSNKQNAARVSELTALGLDRLLVLERTDGTTKLHEVTLTGATNILATKLDDPATSLSLEEQNDAVAIGIVPLKKTLRFDMARDMPNAPK